jgi:peptidoglycan/xylan/chitin deacetylase (PgdA/CDA1 family)
MGTVGAKLTTLRRTLRLAGRARALVLLYHRIAAPEADPQLLAVSPARFAEHLEELRRRFAVVSLSALARAVAERKLRKRTVAVTFDDGYADNLHAAAPALARAGLPATVYVATGTVGTAREFWWDELERILLWTQRLPERAEVVAAGRRIALPTDGPGYAEIQAETRRWSVHEPPRTARQRAYLEVSTLLHPLPPAEREAALDALRTWAGVGTDGRASHRALAADEVRALANSPGIELGGHSVTHARLSSLDPAEQRAEIRDGKARLEDLSRRYVATFSYPYGYRESYDAETIRLVREAGFDAACANHVGVVLTGTDPWELPRLVVRNWDAPELGRRLERWYATGRD